MNINPRDLAIKLKEKGYNSDRRSLYQLTQEEMEEHLQKDVDNPYEQVRAELEDLEHPEPRTRDEYNERWGLGEGE